MAGTGGIGGGGSGWINVIVSDASGTKRLKAFDLEAVPKGKEKPGQGPTRITVDFPQDPGKGPITVDLKEGTTITITWA